MKKDPEGRTEQAPQDKDQDERGRERGGNQVDMRIKVTERSHSIPRIKGKQADEEGTRERDSRLNRNVSLEVSTFGPQATRHRSFAGRPHMLTRSTTTGEKRSRKGRDGRWGGANKYLFRYRYAFELFP